MANKMKSKKKLTKDTSLSSRTNFPGEIQQKTPVKAKTNNLGILPRDKAIAMRIMQATKK